MAKKVAVGSSLFVGYIGFIIFALGVAGLIAGSNNSILVLGSVQIKIIPLSWFFIFVGFAYAVVGGILALWHLRTF